MEAVQLKLENNLPDNIKKLYPFTSNYFELISGHKMHFVEEGNGAPILMVHGNPTWSIFYRKLINEFKSTNRVIVPDHIGSGLSDKPQDYEYTLKNHIDNLEALVKKLNLKNITLVVHDWGGAIGMGYAGRNPENVKNIVILNTAAFRSTELPWRIGLCKIPVIGEGLIRIFNAFSLLGTYMAVEKPMSEDVRQAFVYPYNNFKNRIGNARFVQDIPLNPEHPSYKTLIEVEENLKKLKCPKYIIWGAKDFCFTLNFFEKWKQIYPNAKTKVFENAGHYLLEDAGEEITQEIKEFIKV